MANSDESKGGWTAAIFIIVVEIAERFSFYGITSGLISYLTTALGESTSTAAKNINIWQGVTFLCPLIGAFVADSMIGRFKTVFFASIIYLFGMVLLVISASVIPRTLRRPFVYLSLYIMAVGQGGHKPSVQTFAADQFDESTIKEKKRKSSFYNWWYLGVVVGSVSGIGTVFFLQRNVGWAIGFMIPAVSMLVSLMVFLSGITFYRRGGPPVVSPFTKVAQVFVATMRKWRVSEGSDADPVLGGGACRKVAQTRNFRFLDKAMVMDDKDASSETRNPWRLCTLREVQQVKQVLRLLPIWITCFPFSIVYAQLFTFFIKQANTMRGPQVSPHFKIPSAYIPYFISAFVVLILVVLYERAFVPIMRRVTGHPTGISTLQRIGIGQFLSVSTMVIAALIEHKRVRVATSSSELALSIWWLLPQYLVMGVAEVFVVVGMQHFFYEEMPEELRSLGAAFYLTVIGVGSFLSSGIIDVVQAISSRGHEKWLVNDLNKAHLDGFYWVLACLGGLGFCGYVWVSSWFESEQVVKEDDEM